MKLQIIDAENVVVLIDHDSKEICYFEKSILDTDGNKTTETLENKTLLQLLVLSRPEPSRNLSSRLAHIAQNERLSLISEFKRLHK